MHLGRRDILKASLAGLLVRSRAEAQTRSSISRIGVFASPLDNPVTGSASAAFAEEMRRLGFGEGLPNQISWATPLEEPGRLESRARDMVRDGAGVLVALGAEPALRACIAAAGGRPVIFAANNYDPVEKGYVKSLARPGGNVTGIFLRATELAGKQVEILAASIPTARRLVILWDYTSADQFLAARQAAERRSLDMASVELQRPPYDLPAAFRSIETLKPDMLLVLSGPFIGILRDEIVALSLKYALPTMFTFPSYAEAGGLLSYGVDPRLLYRQAAGQVARVIAGADVATLPVERSDQFELTVNLRTAAALKLDIPQTVLSFAARVID